MAGRSARKPTSLDKANADIRSTAASIPVAEAFSFLQETRGFSTWTVHDMAKSLKISLANAKQVISLLELQGYVNADGQSEFMTTIAGESVSGSKPPRFTRERIEGGLEELRKRIAETNRARSAQYKVIKAVAFGDFLHDRVRVQGAQIGIGLGRRGERSGDTDSAAERTEHEKFLRQLVGRSPIVHVRPYEDWMSNRTHVDLL